MIKPFQNYTVNTLQKTNIIHFKKNNMKKYLKLIFISMFLISMSAMAQQQVPPAGQGGQGNGMRMRQQLPPKERAEAIAKELSLSDADKAKVQAIYEKNDSIFTKFRTEVSRDSPDFREKFTALRAAQDADLSAVIGKEKYEAYQKKVQERRQQMNNNNNNNK